MNSKILYFVFGALLVSFTAGAQAKVQEVVTSDYNRNSVSMVAVQRGDVWDRTAYSIVTSYDPGAKFDINKIKTKTVKISKNRNDAVTQEEAGNAVYKVPFGREILSFIFNRDANGMMDDKLVRYRGNYDAKDQDVINARASRVGTDALGDMGHALVSGSYIVVTDFYNIYSKTDREGKVTWYASSKAFAFRIDMSSDKLNDFYEKCWIYDDDDPTARSAKIDAFNSMGIDMMPVASTTSSGSGKTAEAAMNSSMYGLLSGLENNISDWEVAVTISAKRPLRAKIGTKEGLRNGARYRAYSYSEDRNGNLISVPRGYLRATEISDNERISEGETEPSKFYQISGVANIDEGWTIKQSNDYGLGVSAGVRIGGFCSGASFMIDADYLINVSTGGNMSYILVNAGFDLARLGLSNLQAGAGFAYGLHLTRFLEIAPYGSIILDHLSPSSSSLYYESDLTFLEKSAFVLEPGLKASLNVAYPLQIYGKLCADLLLPTGSYYRTYNNEYYLGSNKHKSGVGVQFGVKWTF